MCGGELIFKEASILQRKQCQITLIQYPTEELRNERFT